MRFIKDKMDKLVLEKANGDVTVYLHGILVLIFLKFSSASLLIISSKIELCETNLRLSPSPFTFHPCSLLLVTCYLILDVLAFPQYSHGNPEVPSGNAGHHHPPNGNHKFPDYNL